LNFAEFPINRDYLLQWFNQDILIVTDSDFINVDCTKKIDIDHSINKKPVVVDITHNPYPMSIIPIIDADLILTGNIEYFYNPKNGIVFFPLFLWMNSLRTNLWNTHYTFDAANTKTQGAMCLNSSKRPHRHQLYNLLQPVVDQIVYTYGGKGLPGDVEGDYRIDVSIKHPVYSQCAVNIVTETETEFQWLSEKICKPFMARQLPVVVAAAGINRFLEDVGLDMFSDIVPWQTWDSELKTVRRVEKIAEFVTNWVHRGTMLSDYNSVLNRIENNKQYFHSEKFRDLILAQMNQIKF
jgi:hypothetical protein